MNPELPTWPGADSVYKRCSAILEHMAKNGHVTRAKRGRRTVCHVSDDMQRMIDAMNKGDEEVLKGLLRYTHIYPAIP